MSKRGGSWAFGTPRAWSFAQQNRRPSGGTAACLADGLRLQLAHGFGQMAAEGLHGLGVGLALLLNGLLEQHILHLYGVSGLANANLSQTVPFIKAFSLPASHPSPRLTTYSHRRSGKNAVRPGSRFHSYRASPHQTAFSLSGNGMITAFPVVASDAINLSIPDSLSISFALVSSNKWT